MSDLSDILSGVATAFDAIGLALAPVAPAALPVCKIAGLALRAGAGFAAAGADPVVEVAARLRSSIPEVQRVRDEREELIRRRFPQSDPVPDTEKAPAPPVTPDDEDFY